MRLSVVIPALNAASEIAACLERLRGADEVIVVDGGSRDDTIAMAERAGATVMSSPPGRGRQLRAGGEAARGDWLLFLHADTRLDWGWRDAVDLHAASGADEAACFGFRLDDPAWQARVVEAGVSLRVQFLGLPYGDQGLLVSRALYNEVGGFAPLPLLEDVDLIARLGRSRLRVLSPDATTSAARWRHDGWFSRSARNLACLALYRLGVSPARIARLYA